MTTVELGGVGRIGMTESQTEALAHHLRTAAAVYRADEIKMAEAFPRLEYLAARFAAQALQAEAWADALERHGADCKALPRL